mmetsp:Transcript_14500/g.16213  ORF Transcript_14500/g.16213 Transcript_14500/m.16213 type:complete len:90 (+) Transcript_14500:50-319(+)
MNSNFEKINSSKPKRYSLSEVDSASDKENKKYDMNILPKQTEPHQGLIDGIQSLKQDQFLQNFEDFCTWIKDTPSSHTLQVNKCLKLEE